MKKVIDKNQNEIFGWDQDNEVQVLGSSFRLENITVVSGGMLPSKKPQRPPYKRILLVALLLGILVSVLYVIFKGNGHGEDDSEYFDMIEKDLVVYEEVSLQNISYPEVVVTIDSINDVALTLYKLHHLQAELSFELPDRADTTVYMVAQAADVRRDNLKILGDYVLNGEQLSRGKRKTGYCAIFDGLIRLGVSTTDDIKDECIAKGGSLFRQYPLVYKGEIQENRLKGKSIRRALALRGDVYYIVVSHERESIYDFAEALCDLGFTHALYLIGGDAAGWWRESSSVIHDLSAKQQKIIYPNTNYIIFRSTPSL